MQLLKIPAAILLLTSVLSVNAEPEGLQLRSPNPDAAEGPGNLRYEESWLAKRAERPSAPGEPHVKRALGTKVKRAAADKRASGPSNGATGHAVVNKRAGGPSPLGEGHPIPKARRAGATKVKRAAADKRAHGPSNGATGHAVVN